MDFRIKKESVEEIERIVNEISSKQRRDFTYQNRVLFVNTENSKMQPEQCVKRIEEIWQHKETCRSVVEIYKKCYLTPPEKRERLFHKGYFIARDIIEMMSGNVVQSSDIEELEKKLESSDQMKIIVLNHIYHMVPQLQNGSSFPAMLKLNRNFAGECIDSIITYIKIEFTGVAGAEDYEKEIFRLEAELLRANRLLIKLQDEFDERIEENRKEEGEKLISLLNSAKYGHILDLLTNLQSGVRILRRSGKQIPVEIGSLSSLVRQLLKFVEDCGITPILEIGEELTVNSSEIADYQYQGSPFENNEEVKTVIVTSTGWEIKEKELILSRPAVQEKE